mgnify:CR=1 FL=1
MTSWIEYMKTQKSKEHDVVNGEVVFPCRVNFRELEIVATSGRFFRLKKDFHVEIREDKTYLVFEKPIDSRTKFWITSYENAQDC